MIDIDPQSDSTDTFQGITENTATLFDVFEKTKTLKNTIQKTPFGDLVASDRLLQGTDSRYLQVGRENKLKSAIQEIEDDYDFIIIDAPPQKNLLLANAMIASTELIIPINL